MGEPLPDPEYPLGVSADGVEIAFTGPDSFEYTTLATELESAETEFAADMQEWRDWNNNTMDVRWTNPTDTRTFSGAVHKSLITSPNGFYPGQAQKILGESGKSYRVLNSKITERRGEYVTIQWQVRHWMGRNLG